MLVSSETQTNSKLEMILKESPRHLSFKAKEERQLIRNYFDYLQIKVFT